jgi:hypothetical protein
MVQIYGMQGVWGFLKVPKQPGLAMQGVEGFAQLSSQTWQVWQELICFQPHWGELKHF